MSKYSKLGDTKLMGGKYPNLSTVHGDHRLKVHSIRDGEHPVRKTPWFAADVEVVSSTNKEAVGRKFAWVTEGGLGFRQQGHESDIKKFIGAILDVDPQLIGGAEVDPGVGEDQIYVGAELNASVFPVVLKKPRKDGSLNGTQIVFSAVGSAEPDAG